MSTHFAAYYPASPLSDCTNAIDNAENISSNRQFTYKLQKPYSSVDAAQNVKAMLDRALSATQQQQEREAGARPLPLQLLSITKPSSPSSPMRHDPYSPCIVSSPMSAYDSFMASYADQVVEGCEPVATVQPTATAPKSTTCTVPAPRSATAAAQQQQQQQQSRNNESQGQTRLATPEKTPASLQVSVDGGVSSTNTSITTTSHSSSSSPNVNRTVVKTVVRCNIDRTSGRPIPVRK